VGGLKEVEGQSGGVKIGITREVGERGRDSGENLPVTTEGKILKGGALWGGGSVPKEGGLRGVSSFRGERVWGGWKGTGII